MDINVPSMDQFGSDVYLEVLRQVKGDSQKFK